ncbi:MAG: divergent polysaccharide deacetylase family protein [Natronospirillum sp.]
MPNVTVIAVAPGRGATVLRAMPRMAVALAASLALCWLALPAWAAPANSLQMSIVIDDIGNNRRQGLAAINLPGNLTFAILPGLSHSRELAELAHSRGRTVMIHMPMDNHGQLPLGPMGLKAGMTPDELRQTVLAALADVPHATGLNNHMGSLLTEQTVAMNTLMPILADHNLFFLDSLTSPRSLAYRTAQAHGVPALRRQVFLDHERNDKFISGQFAQALAIMEKTGSVILIGHPYPETIAFLDWVIPLLDEAGVVLVTPEQLLQARKAVVPGSPLTVIPVGD